MPKIRELVEVLLKLDQDANYLVYDDYIREPTVAGLHADEKIQWCRTCDNWAHETHHTALNMGPDPVITCGCGVPPSEGGWNGTGALCSEAGHEVIWAYVL